MATSIARFLTDHRDAERLENGKIRCTLTGHEMAATVEVLEAYWNGKNYRKRKLNAGYDFTQHEPHLVSHPKSEHLMWCTVTKQPVSRQPHAVEAHVNGKRFKRLLAEKQRPKKKRESGASLDFNPEEDEEDEEHEEGEEGSASAEGAEDVEEEEDDGDDDEEDAFWVRPQRAGKKADRAGGQERKQERPERKRPRQEQQSSGAGPSSAGKRQSARDEAAPKPSKKHRKQHLEASAPLPLPAQPRKPIKKAGLKRKPK